MKTFRFTVPEPGGFQLSSKPALGYSVAIFFTLCALSTFVFMLNNQHMIGTNEHYDFMAGPVLVLLYGLHGIGYFVLPAFLFSGLIVLCTYISLIKKKAIKVIFMLVSILLWLLSGMVTLGAAYA